MGEPEPEPDREEEVGEVERVETPSTHALQCEHPHDHEDAHPRDAASPRAGGDERGEQVRPVRDVQVPEVRCTVDEREPEERRADETVKAERTAERDRTRPSPFLQERQDPSHRGEEDERRVQVDTGSASPRDLDEHVRLRARPGRSRLLEEYGVGDGPRGEQHDRHRVVLHPAAEPHSPRVPRALGAEQGLVRREPARAAGRHVPQRFGVFLDGAAELVERQTPVVIAIRAVEQQRGEPGGFARRVRHRILGEAERDHPRELLARERRVAVDVVHAKREEQTVAGAAEEQPPHAAEEVAGVDVAVVIAVERREHAARELLAPEVQRAAEFRDADATIGAGELGEAPLEVLEELGIDRVERVVGRRTRRDFFARPGSDLGDT